MPGTRTREAATARGMVPILLLAATASCGSVGLHEPAAEHLYRLEVTARVPAGPETATRARIWAPAPITVPGCEQIGALVLTSRGGEVVERSDAAGNRILFLTGEARAGAPLELHYSVDLVLQTVRPPDGDFTTGPLWEGAPGLEAADPALVEAIRKRALFVTAQEPTVFGKLRALARHFVVEYHDGPPTEDLRLSFEQKRGDPLDLCRLYVAHARSLGIEARVEVGWAVPHGDGAVELAELRIWTTVRVPGMEWIPVDLRDLMLRPRDWQERFGGLEEPRLRLSSGTDLRLVPPQEGEPLPIFVRPLVEGVDPGQPHELRMTLRRLDG